MDTCSGFPGSGSRCHPENRFPGPQSSMLGREPCLFLSQRLCPTHHGGTGRCTGVQFPKSTAPKWSSQQCHGHFVNVDTTQWAKESGADRRPWGSCYTQEPPQHLDTRPLQPHPAAFGLYLSSQSGLWHKNPTCLRIFTPVPIRLNYVYKHPRLYVTFLPISNKPGLPQTCSLQRLLLEPIFHDPSPYHHP